MRAAHLSRRDLLIAGGAVSCAALVPSVGAVAGPQNRCDPITDMTMNAPSYATPIGYGRADHGHAAIDPLTFAFG